MIIPVEAEKMLDKNLACNHNKNPFIKWGIGGNFVNFIKSIYKNSIPNVILNDRLNAFHIKLGTQ